MKPYTYQQTLFIKGAYIINEKVDGLETGEQLIYLVCNDPIKPKLYDDRVIIPLSSASSSILGLIDTEKENIGLRGKEIVLDVTVTKKVNSIH